MIESLLLTNWPSIAISLLIVIVCLFIFGELRFRILTLEKNLAHMKGNNVNAATLYRIQHQDILHAMAKTRADHSELKGFVNAKLEQQLVMSK